MQKGQLLPSEKRGWADFGEIILHNTSEALAIFANNLISRNPRTFSSE